MIITTRCIETCPLKPENTDPYPTAITRTYNIKLITPIFGGGVKASENDPVTLIRPPSIRGHLRFWWRSVRGANCRTASELSQREGDIWGTTEKPSRVALEIILRSLGSTYPCAFLSEGKNFPRFEKNHPAYALFPFQGNARKGEDPAKCTSDIIFDIKLTYPEAISRDVDAALWSWVNFGGIGARTRRGCGAVYCPQLSPPDLSSIANWYRSSLQSFDADLSQRHEWPTLPDRFLIRNVKGSSMQGWSEVVGLMQAFRQGVDIGRNPGSGPNRPGRSRWPEPETIRHVTSSRSARHQRMTGVPDDAFPRAELGLPIVFHFKDASYGDPEDSELYPIIGGAEKTRMASPLILRPAICADGTIFQIIMPLKTPVLGEVVLKKARNEPRSKIIRDSKLARYAKSPLGGSMPGRAPRSSSGSALEAFLAFAMEKGNDFKEVGF